MSAMKRGKKGYQSIYVPTRSGRLKQRSTGTAIPAVVRGMKRMVTQLRDEHRWAILDAIEAKRVDLREVYQYHTSNQLTVLEGKLSSVDLSEHLDPWYRWLVANRRDGVRTPIVYWGQVTSLIAPKLPLPIVADRPRPAPFPASDLTKARAVKWLTALEDVSSGTRREYFYALRSFVGYLLDVGVLLADPLSGLKAPKRNPARERWVTADVDETIVANALPHYRAFLAFVKGIGCDVGSAERARKGDVNLFAGRVDVRGTKTDRRAVHQAEIEPWALPYIKALLKMMANADRDTLLFPHIQRRSVQDYHLHLCQRLGVEGYWLKDSRHSVAVRMRKAGRTFEDIAAQLGTSVYHVVTVYARYKPDDHTTTAQEAQR